MDNPAIIVIGAIAVLIAVAAVVFIKKRNRPSGSVNISKANSTAFAPPFDEQDGLITIPIIQLPATTQFENGSLFEITNTAVISRISGLIPVAAQTATQAVAQNAAKVADTALKNAELYKVVIPSGAKLAQSKEMEGAVRGIYRGAKNIKGHANLVKVDPAQMTKAAKASTAVANGVANAMNVGSLVVGQYYMAEISAKLETMSKNIDKIGDFQDREFKSRILSVMTLVGEVSAFSAEIIENDEQRQRKLSALESHKATATELLGQVNITIAEEVAKSPNPNYNDYIAKVNDFAMLVGYQTALTSVLEEISKLTCLLGKGAESTESCYAVYNKYLVQTAQTRTTLADWHDRQVQSLKIDLDKERIAKSGIEAVAASFPAWLIDERFRSKDLKQGLAQAISSQTQSMPERSDAPIQAYDNDVEIVIKDGRYYYLRDNSTIETSVVCK
jgi:hypothetical protein